MTYNQLAAAAQETRLDRDTWADFEKVQHKILARGVGEHLTTEPIYFGMAFEEPPLMVFSVVSGGAFGPTPVAHSVVKPSVALLGATAIEPGVGTGPATQGEYNSWIPDGSFEIAGRHGAVANVPSILTPSQQGSYTDLQYLPGSGYDGFYTWWMQSDDLGNRWVVTDTKAVHGKYSATVTLSGTVSRWLFPIDGSIFGNGETLWGSGPPYPVDGFYSWWISQWGWDAPFQNPSSLSRTVHAKVYATQDCTIEFEGYVTGYNAWGYLKYGYGPTLPYHDLVPVYHRGEVAVKAGAWVDVSWLIPIPYLDGETAIGDDMVLKTSLRVAGTLGTQVWVDDVFVDSLQSTSESTSFTVGVAEWIQDAQGLYVGANLWIKNGTPEPVEDVRSTLVAPYVV